MLDSNQPSVPRRDPWNKGRLIGQKRPLKPKEVWSIRVRLQVERRARNLAHAGYAQAAAKRGPGFGIQALAAGVLLVGSLGAILWRIVHS